MEKSIDKYEKIVKTLDNLAEKLKELRRNVQWSIKDKETLSKVVVYIVKNNIKNRNVDLLNLEKRILSEKFGNFVICSSLRIVFEFFKESSIDDKTYEKVEKELLDFFHNGAMPKDSSIDHEDVNKFLSKLMVFERIEHILATIDAIKFVIENKDKFKQVNEAIEKELINISEGLKILETYSRYLGIRISFDEFIETISVEYSNF